jgi:phenol 2-monooxygenase
LFEVLTIHSSPRHEIDLLDLPSIFHPWDDELGWDYAKVFSDEKAYQNPHETGQLYERYGIVDGGCVILLRPDQHVCMITAMEGAAKLCKAHIEEW